MHIVLNRLTTLTLFALLIVGAITLSSTSARAVAIASDSYVIGAGEYTAGSGINGQSSASDSGFAAAWSSGTANHQPDNISLDGGPSGKGKFVANTTFSSNFRRSQRSLGPAAQVAPPNNTYYMSHLVNAGSLATNGRADEEYAYVGFGGFADQQAIESTANFLLGAFVGFEDGDTNTADNNVDLVIRSRTGPGGAGGASSTVLASNVANNTFNVVMALQFNSPGDEIRWWLDPTDFVNGEAGLTSSSSASGTIPGFQLSAAGDMQFLSVVTKSWDRSFFWDESVLADNIPALIGIPEPSTIALSVVGIAGLLYRRRG